jgi:predicted dehydrogenase
VATPLHWHALNCIHAAQAGKDIYCEKPLTHSITEGRRIVQAVHKYKRVFQTGSQQRSGRNEHIGLTFVRNGVLGKLERVLLYNYRSPQETGHPHEAVPEGLDWDMWCGPAEKPPYNFVIWDNRSNPSWSGIRPFSGGDMTDWGSHGLDIAQWGLGMDEGGPLEVWTEGEPFTPMTSTPEHPGGRRGGPRSPKVYMRYPGDIIIEFEGGHQSGARFIGERGSINVTRGGFSSDPSDLTAERRMQHPDVVLHRGLEYTLENNHYQDWVNCIKERRDPVAPAEAGHRTATFCHLANIARWVSELTGETGQRLKWDATEERFTNSMEANRFVNPPYRTGYVLPHEV